MKVSISSFLRKEINNIGINPDSIHGVKEWEVVVSLLDSEFWSVPEDDSKRRSNLSKACTQAERILDLVTKEFLDGYTKNYLA